MNLLRKILNSSKLYLGVYGILLGYYTIGLLTNLPNWPVWVGGLVFLLTALACVMFTMRSISRAEEAEYTYRQALIEAQVLKEEMGLMVMRMKAAQN